MSHFTFVDNPKHLCPHFIFCVLKSNGSAIISEYIKTYHFKAQKRDYNRSLTPGEA